MPKRAVLDNDHISVWLDEELGLVHHQMHKPCYGEVFRSALMAGVEAMRRSGASRWLSDDRINGALSPEDEDWAKSVWFPATKAAGWKFWGLVQPAQVIGQLNMKRFTETYAQQGIVVRAFSNPAEAETWLAGL